MVDELIKTAVSGTIRKRLEDADKRYFANDNIAAFIEPGEIEALQAEVEAAVEQLLHALVIDTSRDHNTRDTAARVARMFVTEVFAGRYHSSPDTTEFPNAEALNELMIVGPITVRSACSHHLCPIIGRVWIGVLPNARSNLIGLSKYSRLTDWIMSRPQIQEEAIVQLADMLESMITPDGIAIVMEADHFCMHWRGVKDNNTQMINSVMRGQFLENASLRREFLTLIRLRTRD
ncbi:GTP cyclohydrolase I [Henriciella litoralis]|uniref:GTP cyclohydrolase I n=1 Tax=Henriciella litoralis TaxID=568102 RepID=UPI0009FCBDFB|nr:GTP cyclohydrolase I [Henriciella litoralis]